MPTSPPSPGRCGPAAGCCGRSGLSTETVEPWQTLELGGLTVTALPAADGFGDPQISWCVAADGCRVLHAGDTLFHGWWWLAAVRHGPFDVAFLPAGGAVVDLPPRQPPSPLPAGMNPGQAAVAASLLGARLAVPIHYGSLHEASNYVQAEDPAGSFASAAAELGVDVRVLRPGERLSVEPAESASSAPYVPIGRIKRTGRLGQASE